MIVNPDPNSIFPLSTTKSVVYLKPIIKNKNIIVGDFTYFSDDENPLNFEKHVTHHYKFINDKLIIGKFCAIAKGVEFIMNGANHQMNAISTYPFYIFNGWNQQIPSPNNMPIKGDTIIGNDVWIGQNVTILPGVHIEDGAIIGANSTVASDVKSYSIVAGNPAKLIRMRFDEELIHILKDLKWWNLPVNEINKIIPILTSPDFEKVKNDLKTYLKGDDLNENRS